MDIALVSDDRELFRLCRQILDDAGRRSSVLSAAKSYRFLAESDFYIWDIDSNTVPPPFTAENPAKHLFLVDEPDVKRFRQAGGGSAVNILLKPVTRAMLSVFLDIAFETCAGKRLQPQWDSAEHQLQINLRLQKYDKERSTFIAGIAHDLRTPVAALLGYCGLFLDRELGHLDENQRAMMEHMHKSASRLSRMASAIFDLSLESHRVPKVDFFTGDLRPCVDQALHEVGRLAHDKQIAIQKELMPVEGEVWFDQCLIERVFVNVLENSCRFTPVKGKIEVSGYPFFWERRGANRMQISSERRSSFTGAPNSYRVDIRNSGAAIPRELLENIFEQFVAAEGAPEHSGCGLGLAICRTIMAEHHGRIWAENSEAGPVFSLVLPCRLPHRAPDDLVGAGFRLNDKSRFDCHATT
jgi:signal transduction histidine kinase